MRLRLLIPAAVAAVLLLGGAWSSAHWAEVAGPRFSEGPNNGAPGARSRSSVEPAAGKGAGLVAAATTRPGTAPGAATLNLDEAAVLAETGELQLMAAGTELALTPEQWTTLAEAALETQAVRLAYEATLARRVAADVSGVRLEIPMYAAAGDAMRTQFEARLGERLGTETAAEVLARMGGRMEGHFGGFGIAEQTIEVRRGPGGDPEVTRTVKYWNAADGGERLTSRRETHFPAWEDPAGTGWGALLAVAGS